MSNQKLQTPVQYLKGVGPKLAKVFARLGVHTIEDLLYLVPRGYEDRSVIPPIVKIRPIDLAVVKGEIIDIEAQRTRGNFNILKVRLTDRTAAIQVVWFNQPYLGKMFRPGMKLIVSGKVEVSSYDRILQLLARDYEIDTGENLRIVPIYPLTEGMYPKKLRSVVKTAVEGYLQYVEADKVRQAIRAIHFPGKITEAETARADLAFEELFVFQLGLLSQRKKTREELKGKVFTVVKEKLLAVRASLPFTLTAAQEKALAEILADMQSGRPMSRLLQGDVGSGKTIVAALAALVAVNNGCQAAILAPTEILAQQHFAKLAEIFSKAKLKLDILTATTSSEQKRAELLNKDIIVGTHALLEKKVKFRDLGLVVIDEQHRFGVQQRAGLVKKGLAPHLLVMTATPIPRSLALTLYGDLDRSIIDELPPGRTPVKTHFVPEEKRAGAYKFIRSKVEEGRQVFIVYPLVEESEVLDLKAAKDEADKLQKEAFPELRIGLMHGKMKGAEKEKIMQAFIGRQIDILVSTTVIEVGIDVPNATVMLVEHAERFGLSQLHQLRGRIGRGSEESFFFMIADPKTPEARARMKAMIETTDGFKIAEADLRLRGPGDMFGARQSGLPNFRVADIIKDESLLLKARAAAEEYIEKDPKGAHNRWASQRHLFEDTQKGVECPSLN